VFSDLIGEVRSLRREDAIAREEWFSRLEVANRARLVFELDTLLKAFSAYANPRNHPGPPRRSTPVVAQDFREQLVFGAEGLERLIDVARALLPTEGERARVFQAYLESMGPPDNDPALRGKPEDPPTPERALFILRHSLGNYLEIAAGVSKLPRVTFRLFHAVLVTSEREVARSRFFAPLGALEFRPEYDRIESEQILELTNTVPGAESRQLVALTFLALFRLLRYVDLADETMRRPDDRTVRGATYFILATLRAEARALTDELRHRAGQLLAEGYERSLFRIHAREIGRRFDMLRADGHRMIAVKAALEGVAANLRLELRRTFEHDLPPPELAPSNDLLREKVLAVAANLRPALQNAILFLGKSLGVRLDEKGVFDDIAAKRNLSDRLRRDVWMFAQIVRAFTDKARASKGAEVPWTGTSPLQFVREFLRYFRSMGVPLLRAADYPRMDAVIQVMSNLAESDLVDPNRIEHALGEATQFQDFLSELVEQISKRDELSGVAFDKRAAAEALRLYLGSAD
jgi:hypothetical protein